MKKNLAIKDILSISVVLSIIYALTVIFSARIGAITGLVVGLIEINMINAGVNNKVTSFFIIAFINLCVASITVMVYCIFLYSEICNRNPVFLSIIPSIILLTVWLFLIMERLFSKLRPIKK